MTHANPPTAPYGATLLRVTLGLMFLSHLALKVFVFGPAGTVAFFASLGLPAAIAWLTMTAEFIGGLALILGIQARIVAIAMIPLILGTIVTVHGANGFFFNNAGGGWEYPAVWIVMLAVQALIGDGAAALVPTRLFHRV